MHKVVLKRIITVTSIGIGLLALLLTMVLLLTAPWISEGDRIVSRTTSCFDPWGASCDSDASTLRYISGRTDLTMPKSAELLFSRSSGTERPTFWLSHANSLPPRPSSFGIIALDDLADFVLPSDYEEIAPEDFGKFRHSDIPALLEYFDFDSVEHTYRRDGVTLTVASTQEGGTSLLIISARSEPLISERSSN